jgi:hypothetical protein
MLDHRPDLIAGRRLAGCTMIAAGTARVPGVVGGLLLPEPAGAGAAASGRFSSPLRARRSIVNNQPTGLFSLPPQLLTQHVSSVFATASGSEPSVWSASAGHRCSERSENHLAELLTTRYVRFFIHTVCERTYVTVGFRTPA